MSEPQFVRLGNFSGLVGPLSLDASDSKAFRPGGSDISSLTSQSNNDDSTNNRNISQEIDPSELQTNPPNVQTQPKTVPPRIMKRTSISQVTVDEEIILMNKIFSLKSQQYGATRGSVAGSEANNTANQTKRHYFSDFPTVKIHANTADRHHTLIKGKLKMVQRISYHEGPIWAMKFSPNGHYLASGGQDMKVLVWSIAVLPKLKNPAPPTNTANEDRGGPTVQYDNTDDRFRDETEFDGFDEKAPNEFDDELENHNHTNETTNKRDETGSMFGNMNSDFDEEEEDDFIYDRSGKAVGSSAKKVSGIPPNTANTTQQSPGSSVQKIYDFLYPEPYRILEGHTGEVTDLSWSKSNFLLSASTDKTVRLWHVTRNDCLQFFRHPDIVTCVEFHPIQDRLFITGCFDRRLRVWDIIPDGNVKEWAQAPDTITAICFSPDGNTVVSGLIQGQIFFYEYDGMKYRTQMDCRNHQGKYKKGTKVTGMCYYMKKEITAAAGPGGGVGGSHNGSNSGGDSVDEYSYDEGSGASAGGQAHVESSYTDSGQQKPSSSHNSRKEKDSGKRNAASSFSRATQFFSFSNATSTNNTLSQQLLITTNDHRIRLCKLEDYSFRYKYKGLKNSSMQIKASFSDDGQFIICGSEYGSVFVWKTFDNYAKKTFLFTKAHSEVPRNIYYECFDCDNIPTNNPNLAPTVRMSNSSAGTTGTFTGNPSGYPHPPPPGPGNEESRHSGTSMSGHDYATQYGHNPVIVANFAPGDAVRRYSKAHHHLLEERPTGGGEAAAKQTPLGAHSAVFQLSKLDLTDRVIATADSQGNIKIFFRFDS